MISLTKSLRDRLDDLDGRLSAFALTIHDWLSSFTQDTLLWPQYGTSLAQVVKEQTTSRSVFVQRWIADTLGNSLSIKTLLYRHYLIADVLASEINSQLDYSPLYQLIGSTLVADPVFGEFKFPDMWQGVSNDPHPINWLRQTQPAIRNFLHTVAMHDQDIPNQLIIDHGILSSLSLVYGLYLVYVILIFEATVNAYPALQALVNDVQDTLVQLKGAVYHGPCHWYEANV